MDAANNDARSAVHQRPRLLELQKLGGEVYLCSGDGRFGSLHAKALVMDSRIAYSGSANYTFKSQSNIEVVVRLVGPQVRVIEQLFLDCKARASTRLLTDA